MACQPRPTPTSYLELSEPSAVSPTHAVGRVAPASTYRLNRSVLEGARPPTRLSEDEPDVIAVRARDPMPAHRRYTRGYPDGSPALQRSANDEPLAAHRGSGDQLTPEIRCTDPREPLLPDRHRGLAKKLTIGQRPGSPASRHMPESRGLRPQDATLLHARVKCRTGPVSESERSRPFSRPPSAPPTAATSLAASASIVPEVSSPLTRRVPAVGPAVPLRWGPFYRRQASPVLHCWLLWVTTC